MDAWNLDLKIYAQYVIIQNTGGKIFNNQQPTLKMIKMNKRFVLMYERTMNCIRLNKREYDAIHT